MVLRRPSEPAALIRRVSDFSFNRTYPHLLILPFSGVPRGNTKLHFPATTAGRQRLLWGCAGGGPIDDHTDLGRIVSFGPRHDEGLPIGTHVITSNGGAPLELAIE
jgi:hypothetical protein